MELRVEAENSSLMPDNCYISVRVGEVQKLAKYSPNRVFKFPEKRRYGKADIFQRVGVADLCFDPEISESKLCHVIPEDATFNNGLWLRCWTEASGVSLRDPPLDSSLGANSVNGSSSANGVNGSSSASASKPRRTDPAELADYISMHNIDDLLQGAMRALLKDKPRNPYNFLSSYISHKGNDDFPGATLRRERSNDITSGEETAKPYFRKQRRERSSDVTSGEETTKPLPKALRPMTPDATSGEDTTKPLPRALRPMTAPEPPPVAGITNTRPQMPPMAKRKGGSRPGSRAGSSGMAKHPFTPPPVPFFKAFPDRSGSIKSLSGRRTSGEALLFKAPSRSSSKHATPVHEDGPVPKCAKNAAMHLGKANPLSQSASPSVEEPGENSASSSSDPARLSVSNTPMQPTIPEFTVQGNDDDHHQEERHSAKESSGMAGLLGNLEDEDEEFLTSRRRPSSLGTIQMLRKKLQETLACSAKQQKLTSCLSVIAPRARSSPHASVKKNLAVDTCSLTIASSSEKEEPSPTTRPTTAATTAKEDLPSPSLIPTPTTRPTTGTTRPTTGNTDMTNSSPCSVSGMLESLRNKAKERLAVAANEDTLVLAFQASMHSASCSHEVNKAHEPDEKPLVLAVASEIGEPIETIHDTSQTAAGSAAKLTLPIAAKNDFRSGRCMDPSSFLSSGGGSDQEGNYSPLQQWPRVPTPPDACPTPRRIEPLARVPTPPDSSAIADDSLGTTLRYPGFLSDVSDTEMIERTPRRVPEPLTRLPTTPCSSFATAQKVPFYSEKDPLNTTPPGCKNTPSFLEKIRMAEATRCGAESASSSSLAPIAPPSVPPGERRYRNERVKCPPDDHLNVLRNRAIEGLLVAVKSDALGPSLLRVTPPENHKSEASSSTVDFVNHKPRPPGSPRHFEVQAPQIEEIRRQARGALVQTSKSGNLSRALGVPGGDDYPAPSPPVAVPGDFPAPSPPVGERGSYKRRAHGKAN